MSWTDTAQHEHSRAGLRYPSDMTRWEWALAVPVCPPSNPERFAALAPRRGVRRQNNWHKWRRKFTEHEPHLGFRYYAASLRHCQHRCSMVFRVALSRCLMMDTPFSHEGGNRSFKNLSPRQAPSETRVSVHGYRRR
jgi:hypothetical protein